MKETENTHKPINRILNTYIPTQWNIAIKRNIEAGPGGAAQVAFLRDITPNKIPSESYDNQQNYQWTIVTVKTLALGTQLTIPYFCVTNV